MSDAARPRWVSETANDAQGFRTSLLAEGDVEAIQSVQQLAVFSNPTFGRVLILDGAIQVTTADEFIYHEMMAHMALFAHGVVRRVLIVGGGDGGIAREVLSHRAVETVTLVEIDRAVIDLAQKHFQVIVGGAFNDPRLELVIADGAAFVRQTDQRYDVIIVDSPDPVGAGKVLFDVDFYAACREALRPSGILITQSGMPFLSPDWFRAHAESLATVFSNRAFFLTTVPSYTGGPMAHGFSTLDHTHLDLKTATLEARLAASGLKLSYWTPQVHRAAFALPGYIGALVA